MTEKPVRVATRRVPSSRPAARGLQPRSSRKDVPETGHDAGGYDVRNGPPLLLRLLARQADQPWARRRVYWS